MKYHGMCSNCDQLTLDCQEWFMMTYHVSALKIPDRIVEPQSFYCSLCVAEKAIVPYIGGILDQLNVEGRAHVYSTCSTCFVKFGFIPSEELKQKLVPPRYRETWSVEPYPNSLPLVYSYQEYRWKLWNPMGTPTAPKAAKTLIQLKPGQLRCSCNNCERLVVSPAPLTTLADFVVAQA